MTTLDELEALTKAATQKHYGNAPFPSSQPCARGCRSYH